MKQVCEQCKSVLWAKKNVTEGMDITLDTTITFPLFVEGAINEIIHAINSERKKLGFEINDRIILCSEAAKIINFDRIRKETLTDAVFESIHKGCASIIKIDPYDIEIGIAKYPK